MSALFRPGANTSFRVTLVLLALLLGGGLVAGDAAAADARRAGATMPAGREARKRRRDPPGLPMRGRDGSAAARTEAVADLMRSGLTEAEAIDALSFAPTPVWVVARYLVLLTCFSPNMMTLLDPRRMSRNLTWLRR